MKRSGLSRRRMSIALAAMMSLLLIGGAASWARNVYRDATASRPANPIGMVKVLGGRYMIGSRSRGLGDTALRARMVTIPAFAIDRFPATPGDIAHQKGYRGGYRPMPLVAPFGREFAHGVSYDRASRYCQALHKRLPTEVEWEVAARGFDQRSYPWGDTPPTLLAPSPLYDESPNGVESMVTGVAEWTTPIILAVIDDEAILHGNVDPNISAQTPRQRSALSATIVAARAPTTVATIARRVVVRKDNPRAIAAAGVRCAADALDPTSRSDAVVAVANNPAQRVSLVGRYVTDATLDTTVQLATSSTAGAAAADASAAVRYGIAFRVTNIGGYNFTLSPATSQWSLQRTDVNTTIELAHGTPSSFGGWRAPDHLHAEIRGATFELFVNDEFVGHVVDRTYDIGDVGVVVETSDSATRSPTPTVWATNFMVTAR